MFILFLLHMKIKDWFDKRVNPYYYLEFKEYTKDEETFLHDELIERIFKLN